jgi:hypothetical protein
MPSSRVILAIALLMAVVAIIALMQPEWMFDSETKRPKPFGLGEGESVFGLGTAVAAAAILSYMIASA